MTIHETITTSRVNTPQPHTRSAFDRNFIAAASSSMPIVALTATSHGPDCGSEATNRGASARATNGSANTVANASMPASGHCQSPWDATTSSVPRNGAVHVNDVRVNARPISNVPANRPCPWPAFDASVSSRDGSASS